jgi:hypothetical protein
MVRCSERLICNISGCSHKVSHEVVMLCWGTGCVCSTTCVCVDVGAQEQIDVPDDLFIFE